MPLQNTEVLVLASAATQIVAADAKRTLLVIQNQGPNQIAIGTATATLKTGHLLSGTATPTTTSGGVFTLSEGDSHGAVKEAWYGLARTADQVTAAATQVVEGIG